MKLFRRILFIYMYIYSMNLPKFDFIQFILVLIGVVFVIIIVNHFVTNISNNTEQFKTEQSKKNSSRTGKQDKDQKNKPIPNKK